MTAYDELFANCPGVFWDSGLNAFVNEDRKIAVRADIASDTCRELVALGETTVEEFSAAFEWDTSWPDQFRVVRDPVSLCWERAE